MKYEIQNKEIYDEVIKEYGSPLYIYNYKILEDRCNKMAWFKNELEKRLNVNVSIHYSIKANNNPSIIQIAKKCGLYVDSMSPLELDISKKCGFTNKEILYVCNNVDSKEMEMIFGNRIPVCLDSISQVETWGKMYPNTEIMIRVNPGGEGIGHDEKVVTAGRSTKFGICEENLGELFNVAQKYNLNITGVHAHLGSHFLNDETDEYIDGLKAGLDIIKKYFNNTQIVDLGGGFGIPYKNSEEHLDFSMVVDRLEEILKPFLQECPSVNEIKFEPGRYIPCEAGILAGTVNAIKHENDTWWIGTDIGMNELVRPSMYDAYHEVEILSSNKEEIVANICGNICESGDVIAKDRKIVLPKVGDIVLVYDTGAYGYSMASNYTGRPRPAEIMVNKNEVKLIRTRESLEDLEKNIVWTGEE